MLGAIVGDVIGSVHEFTRTKTKAFDLFVGDSSYTDDSVLTFAVAEWILTGQDLADLLFAYVHIYPDAGYGSMFHRWARSGAREPYNSFGNGSAMRVSPVGFAFDTIEEVIERAGMSAAVTHNHEEGIRGAQATAAAVFFARRTRDKQEIKRELEMRFGYNLRPTLDEIRPRYTFNETCQGTVPQALAAFFESTDYEDAIRNAISLGGDADTLAAIAGGIAEAYYGGVPQALAARVTPMLDPRMRAILKTFQTRYGLSPAAPPAATPDALPRPSS
jgi:ADP-ribosylglycohydrolase